MDFEELFSLHSWREIRGCPGRFVLRGGPSAVSPASLAGTESGMAVYRRKAGDDEITVIPFPRGGGLLSYGKPDGTFIHTLNTEEGLARKRAMLGLPGTP